MRHRWQAYWDCLTVNCPSCQSAYRRPAVLPPQSGLDPPSRSILQSNRDPALINLNYKLLVQDHAHPWSENLSLTTCEHRMTTQNPDCVAATKLGGMSKRLSQLELVARYAGLAVYPRLALLVEQDTLSRERAQAGTTESVRRASSVPALPTSTIITGASHTNLQAWRRAIGSRPESELITGFELGTRAILFACAFQNACVNTASGVISLSRLLLQLTQARTMVPQTPQAAAKIRLDC